MHRPQQDEIDRRLSSAVSTVQRREFDIHRGMIPLLFVQYLDSHCSLRVKAKAFGGGGQVACLHCVDGDPIFDALMVMRALKIIIFTGQSTAT